MALDNVDYVVSQQLESLRHKGSGRGIQGSKFKISSVNPGAGRTDQKFEPLTLSTGRQRGKSRKPVVDMHPEDLRVHVKQLMGIG